MNHIFDIIITHNHLSISENIIEWNKTETLLWAISKEHKNDSQSPNILVSRDKHCPLKALTIKTIKSLKLKYSLVEVDTLDLMLSFLYTSNCIALLPQKLIEEDTRLKIYDCLPTLSLGVFMYCHLFLDMTEQLDSFTTKFSFHQVLQ